MHHSTPSSSPEVRLCPQNTLRTQYHAIQSPNVSPVNRDDIEMEPRAPDSLSDPYTLRAGLKTDEELSQLRRRHKRGKSLESYHRKQNDVRVHLPSLRSNAHTPTSTAHQFTLETNGRSYQRSQEYRRCFSPLSRLSCPSQFVYTSSRFPPNQIKIAVWASLVANFTLCVLQRASFLTFHFFWT